MTQHEDEPFKATPPRVSAAESALIPLVASASKELAEMAKVRELYENVQENIPPPFLVEADGRIYKENKNGSRTAVSGLIGCATVSIDPAGTSTMSVSFTRLDYKLGRATFPYYDLSGDNPKAVAMLRNSGCPIFSRTGDVAEYLRLLSVSVQESVVMAHGWHPNGLGAFGLADQTTIAVEADLRSAVGEAALHITDAAVLECWKEGVAAKFSGNPLALFFLCLSFLGVLMTTLGLPVQGFNLVASTSTGKTTLMRALSLIWPATSVLQWNGTTAGIEHAAWRANDTLLVLDEAPLAKPAVMAQTIMFVFNGTGRNLVSRPETQTWAMPVVSTSERRIGTVMRAHSGAHFFQEGILVRILDLASKAEKGRFWNNIHGAKNAQTFLVELSTKAEAYAGVAGPAFVHQFLRKDRTDAIARLFQREQDSLLSDLGLQGQEIEGTVARGLKYFAAAMTVGLIAVTWRILPQTEAEIRGAILEVARNWYDATRHPDAAALVNAVDELRTWISLKADRKLKDISDGTSRVGTQAHVGWRDEVYLYLPGSTLQSIVPKVDLSALVAHLRDEGMLDPGTEKDSLQYKMGSKHGRPRVYRIKRPAPEQDE